MKTIAWDVDDVLNDLMYEWFNKSWLVENPGCTLKYEQITENPPNKLLNVSLDTYLNSLDNFRKSDYSNLKPNREVVDWFNNYGKNFRHIVLSSVPVDCANISANWVIKYFGKWIRSFNFVPSYRLEKNYPVYDSSKIGYLYWLGKVDIFIEDTEKNLSRIDELGIKGLLVKRPWNKGELSLIEILQKLSSLIEKK